MNIIEFTKNLNNSKNISVEQTFELENIIEEFPYFQAAHYLYLIGLKNQNSFKYNDALKKTAAYTTDRSVLFDLITSKDFKLISDKTSFEIEENSKNKELINPEFKKTMSVDKVSKKDEKLENSNTFLSKPLQFDASETHSFNEWMQITSIKPIIREEKAEISIENSINYPKKQAGSSNKNFALIDKFINTNPKIKPVNTQYFSDLSYDSIIEDDNIMTETLAHVYLKQKKYQKAITAFTVLSLKYPEKNSFFANQIEAIKKVQEK